MNIFEIQQLYAAKLGDAVPALNAYAYVETLFEDTDAMANYNAPAGLVVFNGMTPLSEGSLAFFDVVANWAVIVVAGEGGMLDAYVEGWGLAEKVAKTFASTNYVRSSQTGTLKIESVSRQERLSKEGFPTGIYYWVVLMSQGYRYADSVQELAGLR